MEFSRLSSPIRVGRLELKNRIMMPAMHTLYTRDGLPTPRFDEFYWRRAQGGAGLVVVGACRFDQKGARMSCMSLADDGCIGPWKDFTAGMRERGCPVAVQLYHAGRYLASDGVPDGQGAVAPSAVFTPFTKETARAMTPEEIGAVINAWAEGARRAREAGFDAVEVSASAGYLISQFLSPLTNLREDAYGGSFENRCRFPMEVLRAVRGAVGDDYTVLLRYSAHTLVPGAGGSDECRRFAKLAEKASVDLLDLTGGWHESRTPQLTEEMPFGALSYLAWDIRNEVNIPVSMANRMSDPRTAERAIALGSCDLIAMGRTLVAEPDYPRYIHAGTPERIRPCLSCNQGCLAGTFFEKPVRCLSNGLAGREVEQRPEPMDRAKKILVVGGGPAGMECALRAAQRGHRVSLWEKDERLGGQLRLAAEPPARGMFARFIGWYERELMEAGVMASLRRKAEPRDILEEGFDEVILAVGRQYKSVKIPIRENAVPVYTIERLFKEKPVLPGRVAVICGSFVGLETARWLLMDGSLSPEILQYLMRYGVEPDERLHELLKTSGHRVAVFEKGKLGAGYEPGVAWPVFGDLKTFGAELFPNTEVLEISDRGVVTKDFVWPCEAVVVCPGTEPEHSLYEALCEKIPCHRVGNAKKLGRAIDAIEDGCALGCRI